MLKHKLRAILVVVLIPETMSPLHVRSKVYNAFFMCGAKYEGSIPGVEQSPHNLLRT